MGLHAIQRPAQRVLQKARNLHTTMHWEGYSLSFWIVSATGWEATERNATCSVGWESVEQAGWEDRRGSDANACNSHHVIMDL